jgi:hypothetical protein
MVRARNGDNKKHIRNLRNHPSAIVTPAELATYWHLTSAELREYIEGGALKAIRFGTSVYRIRTKDAIEFQRRKRISPRRRPRQSKWPKVGLR